MNRQIRWTLFWLLSFSSIGSLLTHLPGWIPMSVWGQVLFPIIIVVLSLLLFWAAKDKDDEFLRCVFLGTIGGMLGTVGYDVFRIPFHYLGLNLMSPIRAYGMWLTGAEISSYWTDVVGFAYHVSNGITFGWIYALVAHRRSMWWALAWGIALESLAVFSTFGAVFGLQQYSNAVLLAYIAHLFFGWPLGKICEDNPRPADSDWWSSLWNRHRVALITLLTLLVGVWFIAVRPAGFSLVTPGVIELGPDRILPTWADFERHAEIRVRNRTGRNAKIGIRVPGAAGHSIKEYEIRGGGELRIVLERAGIYQLQSLDHPQWRSVFWAVKNDGDYRTIE